MQWQDMARGKRKNGGKAKRSTVRYWDCLDTEYCCVPPCNLRTQHHVRFTYLWTCCLLDTASLRLPSSIHGRVRVNTCLLFCPSCRPVFLAGCHFVSLSIHLSLCLLLPYIFLSIHRTSTASVCMCMCILAVTTKITQLNMRPKRSLIWIYVSC